MDTYRSPLGMLGLAGEPEQLGRIADEDTPHDEVREAPPPAIGTDERRMQVRAYNHWASLLGEDAFPHIAALHPGDLADFGPFSVLLDFSANADDPAIAFLGADLAGECDVDGAAIRRLSDVPARSLLSRITDHYLQIIANQAPIGFEAEFINQRGATILYRGILLPFTSDGTAIDFIYGVINWKELADQAAADELLLEMDQVLAANPAGRGGRRAEPAPLADWADGPCRWPAPEIDDAEFDDLAGSPPAMPGPPATPGTDAAEAPRALVEWLHAAREQAAAVSDREERTRNALYEAIGRAWDFALAAAAAPAEFAALLAEAGLSAQDRAPMTPVVKLVFGADYDKTRLTEYAAALAHARRLGLGAGTLAAHLRAAEGGLKGVVAAERRFRRAGAGLDPDALAATAAPRRALARRLRALPPRPLAALAGPGEEFALVLVRRDPAGEVALLGEVPPDATLLDRAARRLLA